MKTMSQIAALLASSAALLCTAPAFASRVQGQVTYVGTAGEEFDGTSYGNTLRVVIRGTCDSDSTPRDRWIIFHSGRMDGQYVHNAITARVNYSTLTTSFLTGRNVQLEMEAVCSNTASMHFYNWDDYLALYL